MIAGNAFHSIEKLACDPGSNALLNATVYVPMARHMMS